MIPIQSATIIENPPQSPKPPIPNPVLDMIEMRLKSEVLNTVSNPCSLVAKRHRVTAATAAAIQPR